MVRETERQRRTGQKEEERFTRLSLIGFLQKDSWIYLLPLET